MKFNTKFQHSKLVRKCFEKPSLTDQSGAYQADINNIINSMAIVPQTASKPPQFGMKFDVNDYQNSLNIIAEANSRFEELPAVVRKEFGNDPKNLVEFVQNCDTKDKALKGIKLGIFEKSVLDKFKEVVQPIVEPVGDTITPGTVSE